MIKLNIGINYYCPKTKIIIGITTDYSTEYEVFMSDDAELVDGTTTEDLDMIPHKIYKELVGKGYAKRKDFGDETYHRIFAFNCTKGYFVIATTESTYYSINVKANKITYSDTGARAIENYFLWGNNGNKKL